MECGKQGDSRAGFGKRTLGQRVCGRSGGEVGNGTVRDTGRTTDGLECKLDIASVMIIILIWY